MPVTQEPTHIHQHGSSIKKQMLLSAIVLVILLLCTTLALLYGRGYRLWFQKGEPQVTKTGIFSIKSSPTGAQIYINNHLTAATDNSINLTPGKYNIRVSKDGYVDWQKDIEIKKEVVSSVNIQLFPQAPTLQSISTFGVESLIPDPSGTKLAFKIASQSAKKNGIYVFDMTSRSFPVLAGQSNSTQLVDDTQDTFSQAHISWSPDGKQLLASISGTTANPTYYLLKTDNINNTPQDITATLPSILDTWQIQRKDKETALFKSLKPAVQKFAKTNFRIISWSPDENEILYQASESGQMPIFIQPRRIGNNLLYERRDLEKDSIYVYNTIEDVNTRLVANVATVCLTPETDCHNPFSWLPDSYHLLYVHDKKISIVEDDGANMTTIYAGPFVDHFVYPWPDGSKLVILTNLNNQTVIPTLYTVGLK